MEIHIIPRPQTVSYIVIRTPKLWVLAGINGAVTFICVITMFLAHIPEARHDC